MIFCRSLSNSSAHTRPHGKQGPKDLTGIRQRGGTYQVRLFSGQDPVTGKQAMSTGSADDKDAAIKLRDNFRRQVADATAARTSVTLGYLLDEWPAARSRNHPDELPQPSGSR